MQTFPDINDYKPQEVTAFRDSEGHLHPTPAAAYKADFARHEAALRRRVADLFHQIPLTTLAKELEDPDNFCIIRDWVLTAMKLDTLKG